MKNTASKVSAIIFTIIAIAAFAWMTMRPKVDIQATGFALASNGSANTATKAPAKAADPSSDNADKDSATNTEEASKENVDKADKKDTDDSATKDSDSSSEGTSDKDSKADEDKSKSQEQTPTEPKAPTAPAAPESPVAPTTSSNEDNQASDKKKVDNEDNTSTKTPQTDSVEAATPTNKTKESSNTATTAAATAAVAATAVAAQDKQQKPAENKVPEIYTKADNARGTLVIMHGCDYKPDAEGGIVTALHKNLPKKGWNTLSFQLPNLSANSTFKDLEAVMPEAAKNIESSIAMAKEKSDTPIALLAHGCGSQMALAWIEVKGSDSINAYIGLGTGIMNSDAKDTDHLRIPLEAMKFPQLDIFGSADNEAVLKTAPERLGHINRAANSASRQKMLLDADHNMTGKEDLLSKIIAKWLNKKAFK